MADDKKDVVDGKKVLENLADIQDALTSDDPEVVASATDKIMEVSGWAESIDKKLEEQHALNDHHIQKINMLRDQNRRAFIEHSPTLREQEEEENNKKADGTQYNYIFDQQR